MRKRKTSMNVGKRSCSLKQTKSRSRRFICDQRVSGVLPLASYSICDHECPACNDENSEDHIFYNKKFLAKKSFCISQKLFLFIL